MVANWAIDAVMSSRRRAAFREGVFCGAEIRSRCGTTQFRRAARVLVRCAAVLSAAGIVTGLAGLVSQRAWAQSPSAGGGRVAVVLLYDLSGSIASRPSGWHDALRRGIGGVLGGDHDGLMEWSVVSSQQEASGGWLDSIARLGPVDFGVMRFGTASAQPPYFSIDWASSQTVTGRVARALAGFPPAGHFRQSRTYVKLAQAVAVQEMALRGYTEAYLVVESDFIQDAPTTTEQTLLVNRLLGSGLGLRPDARVAVLQLNADPKLVISVFRYRAGAVRPPPPPPVGGAPPPPGTAAPQMRLLRPLGSAAAGDVVFAWSAVTGASSYSIEVSAPPRPRRSATATGTSLRMRLAAGRYAWTVVARQGGRELARGQATFEIRDSVPVGLLVALVVIAAGAVVGLRAWKIRRAKKAVESQ